MEILVLNCGSSSVKYALFRREKEAARGIIPELGAHGKTHKQAIEEILKILVQEKHIKTLKDIKAVGHRIVHGGNQSKSVLVTEDVISLIENWSPYAPLHNPHNLQGIFAVRALLPTIKQVAVFDTGFHTTIPREAKEYAIPKNLSEKYQIQRYGFHGISYRYLVSEIEKVLNTKELKIIACHLGNGSSICAIENGKSRETSMGFTPLEGLIMGTRSGDIDPGLISFLAQKKKLSAEEVVLLLNENSGLKGVSALTHNMHDLLASKEKDAKLAVEMFCHRLTKYIGAYTGVLGGVDVIVFSAGIGEHEAKIRSLVLSNFKYLGIELDSKTNSANKLFISTPESKVKVMVIPTNEELMIARDVCALVEKK